MLAFTVASGLCALAPDAAVLVAARIVQGLVAAPLVPLAMSMLLGRGSGAARSISPLAGIMLFLGPALGPTLGGALIEAAGWRAIFLINVPVGALAAVAVRLVPAALAPPRSPGARFDLPGLVLLAAGLTGLLFGASQGAAAGWTSAVTLASVVTWAAVFLLPVFMQTVQGRSALAAGLTLLPQGLVTGLSTALAPRLLTRFTIRATVLAGFAVLALASLGLLLVGAATPLWLIAVILAGRSVSIGLVINPLLQALTEPLRPEQLSDANTLFNTWQRIAGSFGIGLLAALYAAQAQARGAVPALHLTGVVLAAIAAAAALAALALPAVPNTALARG